MKDVAKAIVSAADTITLFSFLFLVILGGWWVGWQYIQDWHFSEWNFFDWGVFITAVIMLHALIVTTVIRGIHKIQSRGTKQ